MYAIRSYYEINAAQHVFGYFRKCASDTEKRRILNYIEKYRDGESALQGLKSALKRLAEKYDSEYLLNSVITSYSIHYTKLYEDRVSLYEQERPAERAGAV